MKYASFIQVAATVSALSSTALLHANETTQRPQFHGFFSQAYLKTDDNRFLGDSEDGMLDLTDAALNTSWRPHNKLQFSAQLLYRQAGDTDDQAVRVNYALADYSIINNFQYGLGIRAGRVKNPYGLHNSTRDVASSRPSILLPASIYVEYQRDIAHSSDSLSLYGHYQLNNTLIEAEALTGKLITGDNLGQLFLGRLSTGKFDDSNGHVGQIRIDHNAGQFIAAFSAADLNFEYKAGEADVIFDGDLDFTTNLLSLEYNHKSLRFTTEYARFDTSFKNLYGPGSMNKNTSEAWYLQTDWRLDKQWLSFVRYDIFHQDINDKRGKTTESLGGDPAHTYYAKDLTVGLRFDINDSWMLSAEYHNVEGTAWLSTFNNPNAQTQKKHWNLFTTLIGYRF